MMDCKELNIKVPFSEDFKALDVYIQLNYLAYREHVLRFISTNFNKNEFKANILVNTDNVNKRPSIFSFNKRSVHIQNQFNVCFLIPTGIGCELGGHAGDGNTSLKLISSSCDNVVTHPNVVNASDINEIPENALYVEGSLLTNLLMGQIGLQNSRSNRVLVIIANDDKSNKNYFVNSAINSVNGARSTLGLDAEIVLLDEPMKMYGKILDNNTATGNIFELGSLRNILSERKGTYDAVAVTSKIRVPKHLHKEYSTSNGDMANPWGSVEAMLTHFISSEFQVPSAHAPMFENSEIANMDFGIVDSRIAPEIVSTAFFHCVLKGLHKAPKIISDQSLINHSQVISAKDISVLVIPDGVLGLPVLAALHQGIKVIAVKNKNSMNNDLRKLSWKKDQFYQCENYLEATGILNCIKKGISVESVKRPLKTLRI